MKVIKLSLEDYFLAHFFYSAEFFQMKDHKQCANYKETFATNTLLLVYTIQYSYKMAKYKSCILTRVSNPLVRQRSVQHTPVVVQVKLRHTHSTCLETVFYI
jgi:hypothetical protein